MNNIGMFKKRLFWIIGSLIVLITIMAFMVNIQIFKSNERRKEERIEQNLQIFEEMIDSSMNEIENLLISQNIEDVDIQNIRKPRRELDRYLALISKKDFFGDEIGKYNLLDGLFLYDKGNDTYIGEISDTVSSMDHTLVKEHCMDIVHQFENHKDYSSWFVGKINASYYIFRIIELKGIYFGAWMKPDNMIADLQLSEDEKTSGSYYYLCDENGFVLNRENNPDMESISGKQMNINKVQYTLYSKELNDGFQLVYAVSDHSRETFLEQMLPSLLLVLILGSFMLILVFLLTSEIVLNPLSEIFVEEERKKNQAQLQFLQIQTNPHFFNNCLSLIRNLILLERLEEAEKVTLMLGRFTRDFLNTQTEIPLKSELERVKVYYELQKIRYEDNLELHLTVDEGMEDILVPAMSLQTFVENAIKHQRKTEGILLITIHIHLNKKTHLVEMTVRDNGKGFRDEILSQLQKGNSIIDGEGMEHIGIQNIVQRMKLLYGDKEWICFENSAEGGAKIKICIPEKRMKNGEEQVVAYEKN